MTAQRDDSAVREQLAAVLAGANPGEADYLDAEAILNEFVVIPRTDLPEVVEGDDGFRVGGVHLFAFRTATDRRRDAFLLLAVAEHLEAKEAREAEAAKEAELTARRDALANELWKAGFGEGGGLRGYADLHPATKAAINMLMEAQDKLAKFEEAQEDAVAGAPSEPSP